MAPTNPPPPHHINVQPKNNPHCISISNSLLVAKKTNKNQKEKRLNMAPTNPPPPHINVQPESKPHRISISNSLLVAKKRNKNQKEKRLNTAPTNPPPPHINVQAENSPHRISISNSLLVAKKRNKIQKEKRLNMAPTNPPHINIQPENNPGAVMQWYRLTSESSSKRQCTLSRDLSLQAKKHLCYLGWTFFHVNKQGRWELRYRSPSGRNFISLRRACQGCIEEEGYNSVDQQPSASSSALKKPRKCKKPKRVKLSISWLIDHNLVGLDSSVSCRGDNNLEKKGKLIRSGIVCDCCNMIFSATSFEAHAGSIKHRSTSTIFLEDGRSLMDCRKEALSSLKSVKEEESDQRGYQNDTICMACRHEHDGELLLCDGCPASFHLSCLGLDSVPDGQWYCRACCRKRCKRLRCSEDCADDVDVNSVLVCHQCLRTFHIGCSKDLAFTEVVKENYLGHQKCFCSGACKNIFFSLQKLIGKPIQVGLTMTCTLLKSVKSNSSGRPYLTWEEVDGLSQNDSKLNVALGILRESFAPVIDEFTRTDIMAGIVFSKSSEIRRLNFGGFYTVVLERDKEVISVATIRVLGKRLAEIPFVATKEQYRKQGMCGILMRAIEKQLTGLGVEEIVLPAADMDTWANSFGFAKMTLSDKSQLLDYAFLEFKGTTLCHKPLGSDEREY